MCTAPCKHKAWKALSRKSSALGYCSSTVCWLSGSGPADYADLKGLYYVYEHTNSLHEYDILLIYPSTLLYHGHLTALFETTFF